ncbi:MAG: BlaI/MecI/CopY family transcriptional regulator [Planctomycetota bacterium]|jgi:predicted transcriptional regulator
MERTADIHLSRRERQIMDIVFQRGRASVAEVRDRLPERPSYSTVRALMRILERKGHLRHRKQGNKYIYLPTRSHREASHSAVRRLLHTFFDGSTAEAVAALLEVSDLQPGDVELDRLAKMIDKARKEGR